MEVTSEFSMESANDLLEELHRHQEQFFFSKKEVVEITRESVKPLLKKTCQDIAHLMNCERVEIWLFNEKQTMLTIETRYDKKEKLPPVKNTLYQHEVPVYFDAIVDYRTLAIDDVKKSPIMKELKDSLSIDYEKFRSMLDATIVLSWGVGGIICCLSEEEQQWAPVHRHVLASVADMFAFMFDRLHRREAEEHIYELAYTDVLTKLRNEHAFYEQVTKNLTSYSEEQKGIFIYMIIDQFTDIQGVLGYKGADQVLITFANRLRESLPEPAIIARRAFDHFVIYSPITMDDKQIEDRMKILTDRLRKSMNINNKEVNITFSYGISYFPYDVINAKDGLQAAQIALENVRGHVPRNARGVYHSSMQAFMQENLFSEMDLRRGLDLNQFRLFYQPQVRCDTGKVLGFEALLRWNHPEKGLVFPIDIVTLAESTGLISTIDYWVINEAFKQLGQWVESGWDQLTISINLSSGTFTDVNLPHYLLQCMRKYKVSPTRLMIEITENIALEDRVSVKNRMIKLNEMGFSISIDDFGTGYSAFVYLQDYPIQEIKIDRQFIKEMESSAKSEAITSSIVNIGKELGLKTVAEGVETIGEWKKLQAMKCDEIQGFYFSKPLPIEKIEEMMADKKSSGTFYLPESIL